VSEQAASKGVIGTHQAGGFEGTREPRSADDQRHPAPEFTCQQQEQQQEEQEEEEEDEQQEEQKDEQQNEQSPAPEFVGRHFAPRSVLAQ